MYQIVWNISFVVHQHLFLILEKYQSKNQYHTVCFVCILCVFYDPSALLATSLQSKNPFCGDHVLGREYTGQYLFFNTYAMGYTPNNHILLFLEKYQGQYLTFLSILAPLFFLSFQAPFKQYSTLPQVSPHWFLGNKSFGGESFMDNMLNHWHALAGHRYSMSARLSLFLAIT